MSTTFLEATRENVEKYKDYKGIERVAEPQTCKYCGKEIYGQFLPLEACGIKMAMCSWPKCDCEGQQKEIEEQDRKARQALQEHHDQIKKEHIAELYSRSGINQRFKERTFDSYNITSENKQYFSIALKYVDTFEERIKDGNGIMFIGKSGAGKTYLACCIANNLLQKEHSVVFGTSITLLEKIKETYDTGYQYKLLDSYVNAELLIIDDLGKEKPSEWTLEKLYYIIDERYQRMKPIIVTTNYNTEELTQRLSLKDNVSTAESIISRLNEVCGGVYVDLTDQRRK